jgi:predicted transcriptional regulator
MKVLWDRKTATVREVVEGLPRAYRRAYSTILTMMRKIEAKGYLTHETDERTYVYAPTISQGDVRRNLLADLVERVFDGSPELVVSNLLDHKKLTDAELTRIRRRLEEEAE